MAPANIRVLVRIRPPNKDEENNRGSLGRTNPLTVENNADGSRGSVVSVPYSLDDSQSGRHVFGFDHVLSSRSTQVDVYESAAKEIVEAVAKGYNGTIVAYGQTGSGKTHTVFGNTTSSGGSGLVQRSLRNLFFKISQAKSVSSSPTGPTSAKTVVTTKTSFFEIFNEKVYDLLSLDVDKCEQSLSVREDSNRGVYVEGLQEVEVSTTDEAEAVLARGQQNRHVASTAMNRTSSRSHAVLVLTLKSVTTTQDGLSKVRTSKFTLVDLAGSERQKSTATSGARLKEASMINKSLLCLGHVINALVDCEAGKTRHVPFRDSKLTFLLRDSWGGNSRTCLVATVSPSATSLNETISTLKFAQRAKLIKNQAVLNEDTCGSVAALKSEISMLKMELSNKNSGNQSTSLLDNQVQDQPNQLIIQCSGCKRDSKIKENISLIQNKFNQEKNLTKTLKRKLQEEHMVRKFKQSRIDYLTKKTQGYYTDNQHDEKQSLILEINSLRRQVDAPSAEAVEWKVAYEKTREELEDKYHQEEGHDLFYTEEKDKLEGEIEILLKEQEELKDKFKTMNETQVDITAESFKKLKEKKIQMEEEIVELKKSSEDDSLILLSEVERLEKEVRRHKQKIQVIQSESNNIDQAVVADMEGLKNDLASAQADLATALENLRNENERMTELQTILHTTKQELYKKNTFLSDALVREKDLSQAFDEAKANYQQIKEQSVEKTPCEIEYRQKLSAASKDNAILIQRMNEKNTKWMDDKHKLQAILTSLEEQKRGLQKEMDSMKEGNNLVVEEKSLLMQNVNTWKDQCAQHTEQKEILIKKVETLNKEISNYQGQIHSQCQSIEQTQTQMVAHTEEIHELTLVKKQTESNLLQQQKAVEELQVNVNHLESTIANQVVEHKITLADLTSELSTATHSLQDKNTSEIELRQSLVSVSSENATLLQRIQDSSEEGDRELKKSLSAMESIQHDKHGLQEIIATSKETIQNLSQTIHQLQKEKTALGALIQAMSGNNGTLSQKVVRLESETQQLKERVDVEVQKAKHVEERNDEILKEKDMETKSLEGEVGQLKLQMEKNCLFVNQANDTRLIMEKEIAKTNMELSSHVEKVRHLEDLQASLETDMELLKTSNQLSFTEKAKVEEALVREQRVIQELRAKVDCLTNLVREKDTLIEVASASKHDMETQMKETVIAMQDKLTSAKFEESEVLEGKIKDVLQKNTAIVQREQDMASLLQQHKKMNEELQQKLSAVQLEKNNAILAVAAAANKKDNIEETKQKEVEKTAREKLALKDKVNRLTKELKEQDSNWNSALEEERSKLYQSVEDLKKYTKEKSRLEFDLDMLQENHDKVMQQVKTLGQQNEDLKAENTKLKYAAVIVPSPLEIQNNTSTTRPVQKDIVESGSPVQPNAQTARAHTPFNEISSKMDNVLNRMAQQDNNDDDDDDDFDENLFLPNINECDKVNEIVINPTPLESAIKKKPKEDTTEIDIPTDGKENETPLSGSGMKKRKLPLVSVFRSGWSNNMK